MSQIFDLGPIFFPFEITGNFSNFFIPHFLHYIKLKLGPK